LSRQRLTDRHGAARYIRFVFFGLLITIGLASAACALAGRSRVVSGPLEARTAEAAANLTPEQAAVREASTLICRGLFDEAEKTIEEARGASLSESEPVGRLAALVAEYEQIAERRKAGQALAYEEQLTALKKAQGVVDVNDPNEIADLNDVNDVVEVLSIVTRAGEYATDAQRQELLGMDFVKTVFQKAIDKAAEYEVEGKWIEAYSNCYYWLAAIDPNNEAYKDYAERLIEKSQIVAAFQDSPCETSRERFDGIKPIMFVKAIAALNLYYVNIIDYGEMAAKGIERCILLADVVERSKQFASYMSDANGVKDVNDAGGVSDPNGVKKKFVKPDPEALAAWRSTLAALRGEVKESPSGFGRDEFLAIFEKLLILNEATAKLPDTIVVAQFSEAALEALDPYTVMVWPRQVDDFEKMMTNEFTGIGIEISRRDGLLTVGSLLPDTPAYRSGLDAGDVIEAVDGLETRDMTLTCAVKKITGPKGTKVRLTVRRQNLDSTQDIEITRDRITVPTIRGWQRAEDGHWRYMLDEKEKIGYVRLMSFSAETAEDFDKALRGLETEGMRALILDLRFNSGGLLDSAVAVADKFIEEGLIVKTQPGFGRVPDYRTAKRAGTHPNYPVVVLINSGSASASEIVAGAMADPRYRRATLVGERTHGKGSVQGITPFPGGRAQLKYTMAYYHLPSGQRVESRDAMKKLGRTDWGVAPDVKIELRSDEVRKMIDIQRDNDVLVQANHDNSNGEVKKHSVADTLKSDPQLAVGLLVAQSKLIEARAVAAK